MRIAVRDPSKCKATGEGLSRAREDTPAIFTVDPTQAGPGELRVQVEGKLNINSRNNNFLKYTVKNLSTKTT